MGLIVFVKLFASMSLQAFEARWPGRGSDLRVAGSVFRKDHRGTGPPRGLQESARGSLEEQKDGPILFYLLLKLDTQQSGGFFFLLGS